MKREFLWCNVVISLFVSLVFLPSLATADIIFLMDGGEHTINSTVYNGVPITDQIYVGGAGTATTLNFETGADIPQTTAGVAGDIVDIGNSVININGGIIPGEVSVAATSVVTVKGSDFMINGLPLDDPANAAIVEIDPIDPTAIAIINPDSGTSGIYSFNLSGAYDDDSQLAFRVVLNPDARLNLNVPVLKPVIQVYPALFEHDFGDVEVGQPQTYVVQIYNFGNGDLVVDSIDLAGSADFAITAEIFDDPDLFPLTIAPSDTVGVDIEVTYTPSAEGYASAVMTIVSNDEQAPQIEVTIGGVGIITDVPPAQQIQDILDYLDNAVEEGTIVGYGPGRCNRPEKRLRALRHMIKGAGSLIDAGYDRWAICVLKAVDRKTDGERRPTDFVIGDGVETLNQMVNDLIDDLSS